MDILNRALQQLSASDFFRPTTWSSIRDPLITISALSSGVSSQLFETLNLSLLSGEYLTKTPAECFAAITLVEQETGKIPDILDAHVTDPALREQCQFAVYEFFQVPLLTALKSYRLLIDELDKKTHHSTILFNAGYKKVSSELNPDDFIDDNIVALMQLFNIHITVTKIDHMLSVDKDQLRILISSRKEIEGLVQISASYRQIIQDKCSYLSHKINYRLREDGKNYAYTYDFQDTKINEDLQALVFLEEMHKKTKLYHGIGNVVSDKQWNSLYEMILQGGMSSFHDYFTILTFYKDTVGDIGRVRKLREQFIKKCNGMLRRRNFDYDSEAIKIDLNYFANVEFSLLLSDPKTSYEDAVAALKEIRAIQKETEINNYFPYLKFCEFLKKKIEVVLESFSENEEYIKTYLKSLTDALEEAFKGYEWCRDFKFQAFQLPLKEATTSCQDIHSGTSISVFLASGFALPINYEKVLRDLKGMEKKLETFASIVEVHKTIASEKLEIQKIKSEVEKVDRRSIEIIGIFSAIVLFASGSIQIFSIEGITMKDAISWMLMFSYSLVLFIFLIWLITREGVAIRNLSMLHWIFFAGLIIVWILSVLYVLRPYIFYYFNSPDTGAG